MRGESGRVVCDFGFVAYGYLGRKDRILAVLLFCLFTQSIAFGSSRLIGERSGECVSAFIAHVWEDLIDRLCSGDIGDDLHLGTASGASERDVKDTLEELPRLTLSRHDQKFHFDASCLE